MSYSQIFPLFCRIRLQCPSRRVWGRLMSVSVKLWLNRRAPVPTWIYEEMHFRGVWLADSVWATGNAETNQPGRRERALRWRLALNWDGIIVEVQYTCRWTASRASALAAWLQHPPSRLHYTLTLCADLSAIVSTTLEESNVRKQYRVVTPSSRFAIGPSE